MRGFIQIVVACVALAALSACNSAENVLSSARSDADPQPLSDPAQAGTQGGAVAASGAAVANTVKLADARVNIAPIVGAPLEAVTALSKSMNQRARETDLKLVAAGDSATTHVVKGYFSALAEEGGTTVIYVWDVLDPSGNRLHRIQGRQSNTGADEADAWRAVTPGTMQAIGAASIDELRTWLAS